MAKKKKPINAVEAVARLCGYFNFEYTFGDGESIVVLGHKSSCAEIILDWSDSSATLKIYDKDSNPFTEKDNYLISVTLTDLGFLDKSMFFENEDGDCPGCPNCEPDLADEKIVTSVSSTLQ